MSYRALLKKKEGEKGSHPCERQSIPVDAFRRFTLKSHFDEDRR
jgi:hypothetical protein